MHLSARESFGKKEDCSEDHFWVGLILRNNKEPLAVTGTERLW